MIFIKKTTVEKLNEYFEKHNYKADSKEEAYILTDEYDLRAVCTYIEKKDYILIKKIICPQNQKVYIDAVIRALLSSKLDEGKIYALVTPENEYIKETLKQMTQFKEVHPDYDYTRGLLFDKDDVNDESLFCDIFKLFMHHKCKRADK